MNKFNNKLSGKVCYFYNFSITDMSEKSIAESINNNYQKIYKTVEENKVLKDFKIAEDFLYGDGLPFTPKRLVIGDYSISHKVMPIIDSSILITSFEEIGSMTIAINLNFEGLSTDEAIFLKHCAGNSEKFIININGIEKNMSISELFNEIMLSMNVSTNISSQNYLLELNRFGDYDKLEDILNNESKRIYGLMTGDEGWEYIDDELASKRISQNWGSRKFFRFIAFSDSYIFLNLSSSYTQKDYEEHQKGFSTHFYGGMNDYFSLKSNFAGVNHGIIFSIETVMSIKIITKYILAKHSSYQEKKIKNFHDAIKRTNSYRKDLIITLNKLEQIGIAELGELENLVLRSQQIEPIIEKIKYLLELLESDLNLMYSERTNKLVNILTIFGLVFTAVQTILAIIDLF